MRVADYIIQFLYDYGVRYIFLVVGGGAMHLNDAIKKHGKMKYICFHHEQAAAIAAEGYARVNQDLAVVCVTSGPGGLNTLTGVMGQWTDSVPVLYLSGQVSYNTTIQDSKLRQFGDQEVDIVSIVSPIVKYAEMILEPRTIKSRFPYLVSFTKEGRQGPVWVDIPLDIQSALC